MSVLGDDRIHLAWTGMETDLMFNRGIALPGFAAHPLLDTEEGRALLAAYFSEQIAVAAEHGLGVVLEAPTWVANRDRGAMIGADPQTLGRRNREAIELMARVRDAQGYAPVVLSANIGPRADAYTPTERMTADEAQAYHDEQVGWLAGTEVDIISGYTITYPEEAIGIVRAARAHGLPVVIAFTVETDGRLPVGTPLGRAIEAVDGATDCHAIHYMINCAHPDHFALVLAEAADEDWMTRLRGIVANASRCSHAELDEADELDDGDPEELAQQLTDLGRAYPRIAVLGGCCGTDMRHMRTLARELNEQF
ncbi:homocysteine S-methyltransferase [Palleronia aestuarii]|uniref:Homocysteine S-methyltransferase n=1 Tax=Palleronia aestuarii TaxID=568105 RepID=A0A2W7MWE5_9RHOB|nr:homocysteine S-methyltransferase family protein [Palleronia aestuarii]PZX11883.1 homocysteine S-methyltransferase [Palleronia aestuarii]